MPLVPGYLRKSIPALFEDDYFMVFNKPAGLLVIPTFRNETGTLQAIVNYQNRNNSGKSLYPCHRLDRETSGVILFAKGKKCQKQMMQTFRHRLVEKRYIAFVRGHLNRKIGEFKSYISDSDPFRHEYRKPAKLAITRYKVLEERRLYSIVEVHPLTGRTNQIRIHFREAHHPLVGESKYAFRRDFPLRFKRAALHASELKWRHPVSQRRMNVTCPLPEDMINFMENN